MRLRYLSDLHLEFIKPEDVKQFLNKIAPGPNEIAILAGDIGNPRRPNYDVFMKYMSANFKRTYVIAGNHEYYCMNEPHTIDQTNRLLKEYFRRYDNVRFLQNEYDHYDNKCFIGTTLWTNITRSKPVINDVYYIPGLDRKIYNRMNLESVEFLETALQRPENKECVVITHHLPSGSLIDPRYTTSPFSHYNEWFYCDLDKMIKRDSAKIKCWFYGHTHTPNKTNIGDTIFACNPIGYIDENEDHDFGAIVELM